LLPRKKKLKRTLLSQREKQLPKFKQRMKQKKREREKRQKNKRD
jgi:hypothetical protein